MTSFLIQFRLYGYPKEYARSVILDVARRFRVKGVTRNRAVPHITLFGPSEAPSITEVISEVEAVGSKYTLVPFNITGFGHTRSRRNGGKVIYLDIEPSRQLEGLRWELAQRLKRLASPQPWDTRSQFLFHTTIAFKDIDSKFDRIWSYVKASGRLNMRQHLVRIAILDARNQKIMYEYDLLLKRLLNRRQALSGYWWERTMKELRVSAGDK